MIFILTANGFSPGGSSTTTWHNTQTTHITQNNTRSNETQLQKYTQNEHPTQNENTTINEIIWIWERAIRRRIDKSVKYWDPLFVTHRMVKTGTICFFPKDRLTFNGLHSIISHKIATAEGTSIHPIVVIPGTHLFRLQILNTHWITYCLLHVSHVLAKVLIFRGKILPPSSWRQAECGRSGTEKATRLRTLSESR
jgi:hypothetical protein